MLPPTSVDDLARTHEGLGIIYDAMGDLDRALIHYYESIRYAEALGDLYLAGNNRFNLALALLKEHRFTDALEYAHAALRNYETFGDRATEKIQNTRSFIETVEQQIEWVEQLLKDEGD
jgi:tetratricopeptide (TPR) repeat protein